jgi:hypothetical protein
MNLGYPVRLLCFDASLKHDMPFAVVDDLLT